MKKQDVLKTLESCTRVTARCEYLGNERTEVIREYQKEDVSGDYTHLHELYLQVVEAQAALDVELNAYLLNIANNSALNFEALRNGVKNFAENHNEKGFLSWFDNRMTPEEVTDVFFSVSVLASRVIILYTDYMKEVDEVNNVRKARETAKERKARLLAALAEIEAAEAAEAASK